MQYNKPEFWKHGVNLEYPCYQRMLQDLEKKGFTLHAVRCENNNWKSVVFKDEEWLRDEEKEYSDKWICVYETLKILYDKLIRNHQVLNKDDS